MSMMRHFNVVFDVLIYALIAAMSAQSMQGIFKLDENINTSSDILNAGYSRSCKCSIVFYFQINSLYHQSNVASTILIKTSHVQCLLY